MAKIFRIFSEHKISNTNSRFLKNNICFNRQSTDGKAFPKVFCFQLFTEMSVRVVNPGEKAKHRSRLSLPRDRSRGLYFVPNSTMAVAAAKITPIT